MNILDQICTDKKDHIRFIKAQKSISDLEEIIKEIPPTLNFIERIENVASDSIALITEVKKASPSKGVIREDFDPASIAIVYEESGATCLSILTDEPYFQGKDLYLKNIRQISSLPILRKDFMLDPFQIIESRALGADCVLLIMAALEDQQAFELYECAREYDLDVLVEIHDAAELDRAMKLEPMMIGINNRNLKTLEVDINTGLELVKNIPDGVLKIGESGISSYQDIEKLKRAGFKAFLVGESLMKQENIALAVEKLLTVKKN